MRNIDVAYPVPLFPTEVCQKNAHLPNLQAFKSDFKERGKEMSCQVVQPGILDPIAQFFVSLRTWSSRFISGPRDKTFTVITKGIKLPCIQPADSVFADPSWGMLPSQMVVVLVWGWAPQTPFYSMKLVLYMRSETRWVPSEGLSLATFVIISQYFKHRFGSLPQYVLKQLIFKVKQFLLAVNIPPCASNDVMEDKIHIQRSYGSFLIREVMFHIPRVSL